MCGKSVAFWCYMFPLITSSLMLWPISMSDDREENYSTVQYQLGANTMRNYDNEEDLMRYNLQESSTEDSDVMQYAYRINFTSNNRKNDDLIQHKFQTYAAKKHENNSQTSLHKVSHKLNRYYRKEKFHVTGNAWKFKEITNKNGSTSYDFFKYLDRYNIVSDKMCDNIICIRLCCPFGKRLVNGKCIAKQGNFIFLQNMYGYINDLLQNESQRVDELFLLIVHDPCQKTGHYLLNSHQNALLGNGSLYLPYYNTIVESRSYCLAVMDYDTFVINVCFDVMEEIMNKTINHDKNIIYPGFIPENWTYTKDNSNRDNNKNSIVLDKMCNNITCIRLCCPFGNRLIKEKCIAGQGKFIFLQNIFGYISDSLRNESKSVDKLFLLVVHDQCQNGHYFFYPTQENVLLNDGSWYLRKTKDAYHNVIIESTSYYLAVVKSSDSSVPRYEFAVNFCHDIANKFINKNADRTNIIVSMCDFLGPLLFSLMMFIVYSIVLELRNIHGFILRRYSGSIIVVNTIDPH